MYLRLTDGFRFRRCLFCLFEFNVAFGFDVEGMLFFSGKEQVS